MKTKRTFSILHTLKRLSKCFSTFLLFCLLLSAGEVFAQPVTLDPIFGENGMTVIPDLGEFYSFRYDALGNINAVGLTTDTNYPVIVKTDANGILDVTFGTNGVKILEYKNSRIWDSKVTHDNKILLIGDNNHSTVMMQLNEDGSFDEAFGDKGIITFPYIESVNIEDNDYLLISNFQHAFPYDFCYLSKRNYNGEIDTTFGYFIMGGGFEGMMLTDWENYNIFPRCIKILSDQSILIAGYNYFFTPEGSQIVFCKLDQTGQFVKDFADNGIFKMELTSNISVDEAIANVLEDSNGNLVFTGYLRNSYRFIFRVLSNGIIDSTFGKNGFYFSDMEYPGTGRHILQYGDTYLTGWFDRIVNVNSSGTLNTNFNNTGMFRYENFTFRDMKFQDESKLVLGGSYNGNFAIARLKIPFSNSVKQNHDNDNLITIYPNPTNGELRVTSYKLQVTNIEVYDIYGRKVLEPSLTVLQSYDITVLQAGIYFLRIKTDAGEFVKKVIKQWKSITK